ncbi:MAG: elongation factor G [Candidatus Krumholzibacteria bacterium]|nr:elongation factor G [Candidatus Krumholzibacteria bacterium]
MKNYPTEKIRNLALIGPHGVGKTALADAMLHVTGKVGRRGNVDDGSSVFDYLDEEIDKKQTMSATLAWTEVDGCKVNIVDTPGVDDFRGDVYASLQAIEGALFLVKADGGYEVASDSLWRLLRQHAVPTFIVINRLNKEHADWQAALASVRDRVGVNAVPLQLPIGNREGLRGVVDLITMKALVKAGDKFVVEEIPAELLAEAQAGREALMDPAAEAIDELMEKYLEDLTLSEEDLQRGLKQGIAAGSIYPVLATAADSEIGVAALLGAVVDLLPSPAHRTEVAGRNPHTNEPAVFACSPTGEPLIFAFKKQYEAQGGDVVWLRVFSGQARSGDNLVVQNGNSERLGQLFTAVGKQKDKLESVAAGDIVLAAKLKATGTGATLTAKGAFALPPIPYPVPTNAEAIKPRTAGDEDKMSVGLNKIYEEDPTFELRHQSQLSQSLLVTQGDMHTAYILDKLKRSVGVEIDRFRPRVAFKETVKGKTEKQGRHKKQSGGRGQFGDVHLRIEANERGAGFEFIDGIVGGVVPNKFIPAVEKGCRETLADGLLAGYEMVDIKVTLFFGSYHAVDSSEAAFKTAARIGLQRAVEEDAAQLRPAILEPIMNVRIVVPKDYMGDVMGDISTRRGAIQGSESDGPYQVVVAQVPEDELYHYAIALRAMTQGTGTFTMTFSHYAEVPGDVQKRLVDEYRASRSKSE